MISKTKSQKQAPSWVNQFSTSSLRYVINTNEYHHYHTRSLSHAVLKLAVTITPGLKNVAD